MLCMLPCEPLRCAASDKCRQQLVLVALGQPTLLLLLLLPVAAG
jgi:hypothetical protein